ncbi:DUF6012 family protein [Vibrio plantisponsor]|uniref:DUF6012 family protein n=1 Tax=Vibrio plantisponsor TaxID=664643 RepID=UPI00370C309A
MLLHLIPKILNRYLDVQVELIDVQIPELNVTLTGGEHLVVRKPFPNKSYYVACRKVGRKAMRGLLIETDKQLKQFTVITRWNAKSELWKPETEKVLTHKVNYTVADSDFDVISDDHTFYYAQSNFESRWLTDFSIAPPVYTEPRMDFLYCEYHKRGEHVAVDDRYDEVVMVNRIEDLTVPTIEKERFSMREKLDSRLPDLSFRFIAENEEVSA